MVAGFGVSGFAAADNLTHLGASVTALADDASPTQLEKAQLLEILGATVQLHAGRDRHAARRRRPARHLARLPTGLADPGAGRGARRSGLGRGRAGLAAARPRATPRRGCASPAPTARPRPCRCSTRSCAQPGCAAWPPATSGCPIVEAVMDPDAVRRARGRALQLPAPLHRLVGLPSRRRCSTSPRTTWTGTTGRPAWTPTPPTRAASTSGSSRACVYNVGRPGDRAAGARGRRRGGRPRDRLHPGHARRRDGRASSTTSWSTAPSSSSGDTSAAELCTLADLAPGAAARAARRRQRAGRGRPGPRPRRQPGRGPRRAAGVPAGRRTGSRWWPSVDGVTWVDDSKATNPHAAQSSLLAYDPVVWVAGGLAKGAGFDELVAGGPRPAARRRTARSGPRGDRRARFRDTRPMCR